MSLQKNVASQKWTVFAFNISTNAFKTGDAAQITAKISKDFGTFTATNDVNPTELESGFYEFDLTQAETNANNIRIITVSSTGSINVLGSLTEQRPLDAVIEVNAIQISGDATAADNLELQYDGTGYVANTAPATQLALATVDTNVDSILADTGTDGVIINAASVDLIWDEVLTGGTHNVTNSSGKRLRQVSATIFNDGTAQSGAANSIQLAAGSISTNDQFRRAKVLITGGTGAGQEAIITSTVASTDTCTTTPAWITNPDNTSDYSVIPAQAHTTVQNGGYDNATVFIDTVNGVAGTEIGVHGTSTNPSDNIADAFVIATANNIIRFEIMPGSTITMPANSTERRFAGESYSVALNGADIGGSRFTGAGSVSGTGTDGGGGPPSFFSCGMGSVTLPPSNGFECGFFGTFTLGSAGNFTWGGSAGVFNLPFVIDYGSGLNASQFFLQNWGGGSVEIQNAGAGTGSYLFDMHGTGALVINANCSATTEVELHGHIILTNNASGITLSEDANILLTAINAEVDTGISDAALATAANLATVDTVVDSILSDTNAILTDTAEIGTAGAGLTAILTTQMTEAYAAEGIAPTLTQAVMNIQQVLNESSFVGTLRTVKKLNQSSTAATHTVDNATTPTSITRTT